MKNTPHLSNRRFEKPLIGLFCLVDGFFVGAIKDMKKDVMKDVMREIIRPMPFTAMPPIDLT